MALYKIDITLNLQQVNKNIRMTYTVDGCSCLFVFLNSINFNPVYI